MLTRIWRSQRGICPMCKGKTTKVIKWNPHYIKPKHLGGQYTFSNLVVLHPDCRRQVYSLNINITKLCYKSNDRIKEV
ncbi:HNH endonuclease [Aquimarina macrocephali]|uniref:HNH endonuclease n=1 Tax=Aquimarina macrocephali TaxID=666563 RepID=UPI000A04D9A1